MHGSCDILCWKGVCIVYMCAWKVSKNYLLWMWSANYINHRLKWYIFSVLSTSWGTAGTNKHKQKFKFALGVNIFCPAYSCMTGISVIKVHVYIIYIYFIHIQLCMDKSHYCVYGNWNLYFLLAIKYNWNIFHFGTKALAVF